MKIIGYDFLLLNENYLTKFILMMSNSLRQEVLHCFKSLHRVRQSVFHGDERALTEGRKKINEEFSKQKHVQNVESIRELINYSKEVEHELRSCVIQAQEVKPGVYQATITKDTAKLDNIPFDAEACCSSPEPKTNKAKKCGSN
ncbi:complex III assembly factor LYRM7 [Rhynchophorus ferrugineus]|uniref:complex III assembly factor LYRM7 n=1 Tax=Rhynchophorus ferrugineus TaxID=354439 RepID=UPI003FCCF06A